MVASSVGILGTGSYVPSVEVGNDGVAARFDVTDEWIVRKTGIRTRRHGTPGEATSDMAVHAACAALDHAGITADQVDHLIVASSTGDSPLPPVSCLVQARIGATRAGCLDVNTGCSGMVSALAVASGLMARRPGTHALLVAADMWSRFTDPADRSTSVLMADGAGACVLGAVPDSYGIVDIDLLGYGHLSDLLVIPGGGSRQPASHQTVDTAGHTLRMRGREVTEFVLDAVPAAAKELLARNGVAPSDVDHFVPHQANGAMLERLAGLMALDNARTHLTVAEYGNSGSASMGVTLDEANRAGELRAGDLVLLAGFGAGMAVGTALLRWGV
ncbi:ketoacyl-ACP synthase III [Kibdelosporangium lantanae]